MKFVTIDPRDFRVSYPNCKDLDSALQTVGLAAGEIDHGLVYRNVGIVVYEFGLWQPPGEQKYFSVGGQLFAGPAVLYGVSPIDASTVDLTSCPPVLFFRDAAEVERAILAGTVARPQMSAEGVVLWRWPDAGAREAADKLAEIMLRGML